MSYMILTKTKNLYLFKFLDFNLRTSKNDACNEDWMLLCFIICPLCHVLWSSGDEMLIHKFVSWHTALLSKKERLSNNCINEPCSYLTQYARGEYCCDGKCSLNCSSCFYDLHCLFLETCCGPLSVGDNLNSTCQKSSCLGRLCVDNCDCLGYSYCCARICQFECSYCHNDTEWRSSEVCCGLHLYNEGHCAKSCVNSCKFYYHCPPWQFCRGPGKVGKCATSCVGKLCNFDYRCASRESCCSDGKCIASCVGTSCDGKSDCRSGEICCDLDKNSVGTCIKSCIGKSCGITLWDRIFERTCASGKRCCRFSKRCGVNCIGEACTSNSHCTMGETCCDRANGTGKWAINSIQTVKRPKN